jgi:hypothetical protein
MAGRLGEVLQKAGRDVFVPLTFSLACKLEQVSREEFAGDLGLAAFALRSAQALFVADGTINWFDGSLDEASTEAATELARRLCAQSRATELVLGYVPGPASATSLEEGGAAALTLARAYGEAGVSALLVAESGFVADAAAYTAALAPVCNLADYYRMPVVWLCREAVEPVLAASLRKLKARVAAEPGGNDEVIAFPLDNGRIPSYKPGRGRLLLSHWDIADTAEPAALTAFGKAIREGTAT